MDQPVPHTDIRADGWIGRLPVRLRPYALLARLDRPIGTWLLFLPGVWGILLPDHVLVRQRIFLVVLFGIGSVVMRAAGCVVNDMWDRDIDRQVTRTAGRPLASGALSMREAALFLAALLLIGFNILMSLNSLSQILGASSLILVGLYPLAKRVTWWPQLVMGFTFGFGAPLGYAAAADRVDAALCALYGATIVWQLGFDTIYGFQDMEDDARIGVRSTSRLMSGHARLFVGTCYILTLTGLGFAAYLAHAGAGFWYLLPLPAALLGLQVRQLDEHDPATCLRLFRFNRETGLAIALTVLAGTLTR
ncbi:4-hydroxybenzoate octaprenyltransferase [Komagataeibacter medellinensis]|uniref:4-hydroxybenzoate octaprenyltransferase n=2 Tax=Komagataeibacter medellinensis TaxID=1177712 RepID=G2I4K1_KOMMN|nr:4-hydroxybenzoate octaprenyltransferase [Komagataeibacter medellinensis]KAB8125055.1 4-hydroxybenzoate octaprenyltransferase [Komagataeibacter medellinensis]BAK83048.1 4-hydroxybenzoate polyprenyltransferase [Komagataeibacter medellinensis NBRC 3288]